MQYILILLSCAVLVFVIVSDMVKVNELQKRKEERICIIEKGGVIKEMYSF